MYLKKLIALTKTPIAPVILLILFTLVLYYKFFLFGYIPFPGDLLIGSYFPWLDYFKQPVKNPLISDVFSQFFLWKYLAIESMLKLEWPLWNPYSFTGNPLLATYHSATLYPLNILLLLPKYSGWGFFIYSQTLIAALTFYLFLSQLVTSKIARLSGAIIFSLSSLMSTWLELGTAVHAMAWLPLSFYAVKKFTSVPKYRYLFLLIVSLVFTVLAGNAQITTYVFIIVTLYSLWINWQNKFSYQKIFLIFITILSSILITSLQLLPSYELFQKSIRQIESYSIEGNYGLLNTKDFLKFFIADYYGNPVTRNYWGNLNYSETSVFLGTLTLPLLIYGLFKLRDKQSIFFLILLALSVLLAFDNPISQAIYHTKLPLLTSSYASRILFITLFATATLDALAINNLIESGNYNFFSKTLLWSWATVLGTILGTVLVKFFILNNHEYDLENFNVAVKNSLIPFAITTFFLITTFVFSKLKFINKNKLHILTVFIFVILTLDLGRYFLKFNPFIPNNDVFPTTPSLTFLQNQPGLFRIGREHAEIFPPNTWTAYGLYSYEGYDPIYLNQYGQFMHLLNGGDIRTGSSTRYAELSAKYSSSFLDFVNLKYFIAILRNQDNSTPGDLLDTKVNKTGYKLIFKDKSTAILENPNVVDRIYFAKKIITGSTEEIKEIFMTNKSFDPRDTIALSKNLGVKEVDGKGDIEIISYTPNFLEVKTKSLSEQVLIISDQFDTGWNATLDHSQPLEISPANLIFRAVKIPSGEHKIVFNYYPSSFHTGLKISLITLAILLATAGFSIYKRRF